MIWVNLLIEILDTLQIGDSTPLTLMVMDRSKFEHLMVHQDHCLRAFTHTLTVALGLFGSIWGAEQVLLLGDFIFIGRSNGPYSIFNPFTLLVVESNEILRVHRDYSVDSVIGLP